MHRKANAVRREHQPDFFTTLLLTVAVCCGFGQAGDEAIHVEVAAIHESVPVAKYERLTMETAPAINVYGSQLFIRNYTVVKWIAAAYEVPDLLVSGPGWISSEKYDLTAKAPPGATRRQIPAMLRPLMEERFALKIHKELKLVPGYALVVARRGPELQPSPGFQMEPTAGMPSMSPSGKLTIPYKNYTMPVLARLLTNALREPTIDSTGLTGSYDFSISQSTSEMAMRLGKVDPDVDSLPATLVDSLHVLGLKLERRKVQVEQIVVDNISRPTEN